MLKLSPTQLQLIRGRLIFTIGMAALYQPLGNNNIRLSIETYSIAFVLTLIAIWMPKRFRKIPYYVCVTAGTLMLGGWQWVVLPPHVISTNSLIPATIILAGAPTLFRKLSIVLMATVVLITIVGGTYPGDLWNGIAQVGIYMGVRSMRGHREMEAMRQRYVTELESTLSELKSAQAKLETDAAQSMHYAAQAERFRIARDIHDGLGHQLTSLIVQLQALSYMIPESLTEVRSHVPKLLEVARAGLAEVRQSVRDWEEADNSYGLAALTAVVEEIKSTTHCNIDFQTAVDEHEGWPASVQIVLYRVLQETLANTVRHSNARHIAVRLIENNQQVKMIVADNGSIATQTELHPGFGLRNMKTRCEEIGGSCRWEVLQEGGVSVEVVLPLVDTS